MEYNKLSSEIFNPSADNLAKLAALFPDAVKDGQLDIAALKEELGEFEEVGTEKYELTWAGKQAAKKLSQTDVVGRTLKYIPEDSKDADTTQNLYIEGDNLEVLKLLRQNYYGAVKMIYIDPPYNTGNDFVYRDNFTQSQAESNEAEGETVDGDRMVVNQKSGNRYHANWLSMLFPRLRVAKDLLRDDGAIFISIDENEVDNLKKACNEVFGEVNFVSVLGWQKVYSPKNQARHFSNDYEFVLCYAKNIETFKVAELPRTAEMNARYKNPDNDPRGDWKAGDCVGNGVRKNGYYDVVGPTGKVFNVPQGKHWVYAPETMQQMIADNRIWFGKDKGSFPAVKQFLSEVSGRKASSLLSYSDYGHTDMAAKDLKKLFPELEKMPFDTPKPVKLVEMLSRLELHGNDIFLDFFSGSATSAQSIMRLNADDDEHRRYILVQYPEAYEQETEAYKAGYSSICEIGKERIRRAGEKIKAEIEAANAQLKPGEEPKKIPDIGFRVFRTADTNIRWTHDAIHGQLKLDESMLSDKDRLDFMPGYTDIDVVYEILLRQRDIPLSSKVEKLNIGNRTYIFADAYVVCLDDRITAEFVETLAAIEPTPIKYVFRDSAFEDNISLKDETIRRLEAYIARNSGNQKKTYTVEFI